jgi:hypothetical protein
MFRLPLDHLSTSLAACGRDVCKRLYKALVTQNNSSKQDLNKIQLFSFPLVGFDFDKMFFNTLVHFFVVTVLLHTSFALPAYAPRE